MTKTAHYNLPAVQTWLMLHSIFGIFHLDTITKLYSIMYSKAKVYQNDMPRSWCQSITQQQKDAPCSDGMTER